MFLVLRYLWVKNEDEGSYQSDISSVSRKHESPGKGNQTDSDVDDDEEYYQSNPYAISPHWRSSVPTQDMLEEPATTTNDPSDLFFMNRAYRGDAAREVLDDMEPVSLPSERDVKSQAMEHYQIYKMAQPPKHKRKNSSNTLQADLK